MKPKGSFEKLMRSYNCDYVDIFSILYFIELKQKLQRAKGMLKSRRQEISVEEEILKIKGGEVKGMSVSQMQVL